MYLSGSSSRRTSSDNQTRGESYAAFNHESQLRTMSIDNTNDANDLLVACQLLMQQIADGTTQVFEEPADNGQPGVSACEMIEAAIKKATMSDSKTTTLRASLHAFATQRFWVGWVQPGEDHRPLGYPPNDQILGWWCSGYDSEDNAMMCACVVGKGETVVDQMRHATTAIEKEWPEATADGWQFCDTRESDWQPSDRFPLSEWMVERFKGKGKSMSTENTSQSDSAYVVVTTQLLEEYARNCEKNIRQHPERGEHYIEAPTRVLLAIVNELRSTKERILQIDKAGTMQHVQTPVRFRKVRNQDVNAVNPPYVLHRANEGCDWIMGRLIGRHSGKSDRKSCWLVEHWCGTLTHCDEESVLIMEQVCERKDHAATKKVK